MNVVVEEDRVMSEEGDIFGVCAFHLNAMLLVQGKQKRLTSKRQKKKEILSVTDIEPKRLP